LHLNLAEHNIISRTQLSFHPKTISHKIAESAEDFRRMGRLNVEELDYLVKLALEDKEDIHSLEPEDIDTIMELVEQKISAQRMKELKQHLA
jgi:hypothetical protein